MDVLFFTDVLDIAPSLHSDENFGMSPYNILKKGGRCLITDWGGFAEYREWFEDQVSYINVYSSDYGPILNIKNLADSILKELDKPLKLTTKDFKEYYSFKGISKLINTEIRFKSNDEVCDIEPTEFGRSIEYIRGEFLEKGLERRKNYGARIFQDYNDKNALPFLNGYAKNILAWENKSNVSETSLLPWVDIKNKKIYINDFRMGEIVIDRNKESKRDIKVKGEIDSFYISKNEYETLFSLGCII